MTDVIKIMIVEDESIVAMDLATGLEIDGYQVTGIADNFSDAIKLFTENVPDIVLMDINIQGDKDGVDIAMEINKIKQLPLIYLTAYTDVRTIDRVKATNPAAFLTKPYTLENVRIAIDLAIHNFAEKKDISNETKVIPLHKSEKKNASKEPVVKLKEYVFIKQNYRFVKFKYSEILFLESDHNHVKLYTTSQNYVLRVSLTEVLESLEYESLVRVHRSFAVNIDAIQSFDEQIIKIEKHEIPIGGIYRQEFLSLFNLR